MRELTIDEEVNTTGGTAFTLASIMALLAIGVVAIVCYKIFTATDGGKVVLPGGYTFQWND